MWKGHSPRFSRPHGQRTDAPKRAGIIPNKCINHLRDDLFQYPFEKGATIAMRISPPAFAATARYFFAVLLVFAAAPLCRADDITYSVDLSAGSGSVTGDIVTDGTIGSLTATNIVDYNLLWNDGTTTFDLTGPLSGGNSAYGGPGILSATSTQLLFDFGPTDTNDFLYFASNANFNSGATQYEVCFEGNANDCTSGLPAGAVALASYTYTGVGDETLYTPMTGDQVIGTASGSSNVPEPPTLAILGAGIALLSGFRRRSWRLS
jgi:hypothetical protein